MGREKNQGLEVGTRRGKETDPRNGTRKKIKKETEAEIGTKKMTRIATGENRYGSC